MKVHRWLIAVLLCSVLLLGCGGGSGSGPGPEDIDVSLVNVSFSNSVQPIFNVYCTVCHFGGNNSLVLTAGDSYTAMINVTSLWHSPANIVTPGDSADSTLYGRVSGSLTPQMPKGGTPLSTIYQSMIGNWIDEGALDN